MAITELAELLEQRDELLFLDAPGAADLERLGWTGWPMWEAGMGLSGGCPC